MGGTVPGGRGCGLPEGGPGLGAGMQAAGHRWGGRECVRWALPAGREEGVGGEHPPLGSVPVTSHESAKS